MKASDGGLRVPRWCTLLSLTAARRSRRPVGLLLLLLGGAPSLLVGASAVHACRCAQRPIESYFTDADVVVIGRAVETWIDADHPQRRRVRFADLSKPYKGDPIAFAGFATAVESAACGYQVEVGRQYVVFAARRPDDRFAWFDTCTGTRSVDRDAEEGAGDFIDVPADGVLPRLSALRQAAGGDPRASATAVLPRPGDPGATLIGLLELPGVLPAGEGATPPRARSVTIFTEPSADAPVRVVLRSRDQVATREVGYEAPGAVVRERRDGWYRIRLADGSDGWLRAVDAGAYHPVAELLVNRLSYLGPYWDGWLWPASGAGYPQRAARRVAGDEQPARVLATEIVGGTLWLQVELLDASPCDGGEARVVHAGWVPAYTPAGDLVAWFYSRGC